MSSADDVRGGRVFMFVFFLFCYGVLVGVTLLVVQATTEVIDFLYLWGGLSIFNAAVAAMNRWEPRFEWAMLGVMVVNWLVLVRYAGLGGLKGLAAAFFTVMPPVVLLLFAGRFLMSSS